MRKLKEAKEMRIVTDENKVKNFELMLERLYKNETFILLVDLIEQRALNGYNDVTITEDNMIKSITENADIMRMFDYSGYMTLLDDGEFIILW